MHMGRTEEYYKNNNNNNNSMTNTNNCNSSNIQWNIWQQFQWPNQPEQNRWSKFCLWFLFDEIFYFISFIKTSFKCFWQALVAFFAFFVIFVSLRNLLYFGILIFCEIVAM